MTVDTEIIRQVLFDEWDPIGVGPYARASSNGILDEYDEVVDRLSVSSRAEEIICVLEEFEKNIGLNAPASKERRAAAANRLERIFDS